MDNIILIFLISFFATLLFGFLCIRILKRLNFGQNILHYVESHLTKQGTPTMGGIMFILPLLVIGLLLFRDDYTLALITIFVTIAYGVLGFLDDFLKIKLGKNEGLKAYQKAAGQVGIATILAFFVYNLNIVGGQIIIPFVGVSIDIGVFIIPFIILFFLSITNAVNLTDGLDGLASCVSILVISTICVLIYLLTVNITNFNLQNEYFALINIGVVFISSLFAFLIFNCFPAKVFMGDTGSLAIGGFISCVLCFSRLYFIILLIGMVFVINALSVIIQVLWYKKTKKRVFKMAPLHHHFEKCGFHENKVVIFYVAFTIVCCMIAILFSL